MAVVPSQPTSFTQANSAVVVHRQKCSVWHEKDMGGLFLLAEMAVLMVSMICINSLETPGLIVGIDEFKGV